MLKKTCYIVEDNEADKNVLLSYIEKSPFISIVGSAPNYADAISFLLTYHVDILFLDIEISDSGELNGIDIIKSMSNLPSIIITSNHEKFAVDSYTVGKTSDYLLKPFDFNRYLIAVNRALNTSVPSIPILKQNSIFFKMGRQYQKFNLDEILYFETYGIYLKVYTTLSKKPFVINESLVGIMERLDNSIFIRIHKSFVVNVLKIDSFNANNIILANSSIPIGVSYKSKVDYLVKLFVELN